MVCPSTGKEGRAKVSRNGVSLATLSSTAFFGELALLDGGERTATVVAETDLRLQVLSRGEFKELCRSYPSVMTKMLVELGARLRRADEMLGGSQARRPNQLLTVEKPRANERELPRTVGAEGNSLRCR